MRKYKWNIVSKAEKRGVIHAEFHGVRIIGKEKVMSQWIKVLNIRVTMPE
jgi:hypothetical protein